MNTGAKAVMNTTVQRKNKTVIIEVEGQVDGTNSRKLYSTIQTSVKHHDKIVILDLKKLKYISSAGLRVILLIARTLQNQKTQLAACSLTNEIQKIFTISGFHQLLKVYNTREQALAALQG